MKVIATLAITGEKETRLEGVAQIFDSHIPGWLSEIGFWLENWRYAGNSGPNNKTGRVFIPWSSALYIQELK